MKSKLYKCQECGSEKQGCKANARLIAAAPELLEACKALFGLVESGHLVRDVSGDVNPGWVIKELGLVRALSQAKEAIAKAEGDL